MAIQANRIFLCNGVCRILAESNRNGVLASPGLDVGSPGPMTRFASAGLVGSPRICHHLAHDGVLEAAVLILVAGYTGLAAYIVAISRLMSGFGLLLRGCGLSLLFRRLLGGGDAGQSKRDKKRKECEEPALGNACGWHGSLSLMLIDR